MDFAALLMILVVSAIVGLALYFPFWLWFRWRRSKGLPAVSGHYGRPLSRRRTVLLIVPVLALLAGNVMQHFAPDSWLSKLSQSHVGSFTIFVIAMCVAGVADLAWFLFKTRHRKGRQPDSESGVRTNVQE